MSKWTDDFGNNPLHPVWGSLCAIVKDSSLEDVAEDSVVEDIARIRKVVTYLNGIFEKIDPEITPTTQLLAIQKASESCIDLRQL